MSHEQGPPAPPQVRIRRAREADAKLFAAWRSMPEIRRYQPIPPLPEAQLRRDLRRDGSGSLSQERGRSIVWIIEDDDTPAGWVALRDISWQHRTARLAYTVAPWAQGRGVGSRGVALALDLAVGPGRMKRVEAECDVDNAVSQKLLERLGFQREGRLRSLVSMPGGGRRDYYLYSILSEEWPSAEPRSVDPG